ncbi:hypothetical protein [Desulfosarcina ovata]|uniref:Uncharacterized protein n=1 Tax=Desulfosarcina ovata subsp. ovata TaxID=2752305 RepID=A0A5K8AK70_9BACT|nr:hypothetical protein [Desulfosarcina ovata]BBO92054.1 hypothetical protein DSCOOX_52340 [Desulfosarcina ovata subsp. ovata]
MKTKITLIIALLICLVSATPAFCEVDHDALQTRIAYNSSGDVEYSGVSSPNVATSDTAWRIQKIIYDTSGNVVTIVFPNGDSGFNYVWDDRESYTYPD